MVSLETLTFAFATVALILGAGAWLRYQLRKERAVNEALRTGEQRLNLALLGSGDGLWDWNMVSGEIYRAHMAEMLGYEPDELPQDHSLRERLIHPDDHDEVEAHMQAVLAGEAPGFVAEYRMRARDGEWRWILDQGSIVSRDADGKPLRIAGTCRDITERKRIEREQRRVEERLRVLANYDTLTDLPNRAQFQERLGEALERMRESDGELALIFADVDHFKHINDSLGHAVGDQLLRQVARRLRSAVRQDDLVARLGGDEFTAVMEGVADRRRIPMVAERILRAIDSPFRVDEHEISVTASIGISLYPQDGADVDVLLKHADIAMYQAKAMGRNQLQFFTDEMSARVTERLSQETLLRRAEERGELELVYQPRLSLRGGEVTGVEALLRWRHPERGLLTPDAFLDTAEETGLIIPIGDWVLRTACAQAVAWRERGLMLEVAVNLSASQLRQETLAGAVAGALETSGLDPGGLLLELTESVTMDADSAAECIGRLYALKDLGVRLAIDDFGTGYSSLSYLKRLPIDALKIDRSFVSDLIASPRDAAIVEAIVAMARSLRLEVMAEGVETPEQLAFLRRAGCEEVQGFLFSRPRSAGDIPALVAGPAALNAAGEPSAVSSAAASD